MTNNEWLTLAAIVIGPMSAVGITLAIEKIRRTRERRLYIVRLLLATRHLPADAQYNVAVNLIPADFNDQKSVMDAWRNYHAVARERIGQPPDAGHQRRMTAAQSTMIFQAMQSAGLELSEGDIQTESYVSQGFIDRDNLYLESLRALPTLANAMQIQVEYTRQLVERALSQGGSPPPRS